MALNLFGRHADPGTDTLKLHIARLQNEVRLTQRACERKQRTIRGLREKNTVLTADLKEAQAAAVPLASTKAKLTSAERQRVYGRGYAAGRRKEKHDAALNTRHKDVLEGVTGTNGSGGYTVDRAPSTPDTSGLNIKTSQ